MAYLLLTTQLVRLNICFHSPTDAASHISFIYSLWMEFGTPVASFAAEALFESKVWAPVSQLANAEVDSGKEVVVLSFLLCVVLKIEN